MSEQSFTPGKLVLKRAAFRPTFFVMREGYTSDEAAIAEVIDPRYAPVFAASPALLEALKAVRAFAEAEVENREHAGGSMSDYINEAQEVVDTIDAAISQAEGRDHG